MTDMAENMLVSTHQVVMKWKSVAIIIILLFIEVTVGGTNQQINHYPLDKYHQNLLSNPGPSCSKPD